MWFDCEPVPVGYTESSPFRIENTRIIDATAARVFEIFATGEGQTAWFQDLVSIRWFGTPGGLGSEREVALKLLRVKERFIVWDEGKRLTFHIYESTLPLVSAMVEDMRIDVVAPDRARLTWRVHYTPTAITRLVHPIVRVVFGRMFEKSIDGLARYASAHPKAP